MNKKYKKFIDAKLEDWQHYNTITLKSIKMPITVLIGPNGTGKSMSLRLMKEKLRNDKSLRLVSYSTSQDDIVQKGAPAFGDWDVSKLAMAFASEGERMTSSFMDWCNSDFLHAVLVSENGQDKDTPLWVLVDEADSGLSLDRLILTITQLFYVVISEVNRGRDIHVVLTCNSWEMLDAMLSKGAIKYIDIKWVPTGESIHPRTYEQFQKPYREYFNEIFKEELLDDES